MKKNRGFTLLELIAVMALIAIMAALAVPNYLAWLPKYRLDDAARSLRSDLRLARMRAVSEGRIFIVTFEVEKGSYNIYVDRVREENRVRTVVIGETFKGVEYGYLPGKSPSGTRIKRPVTFSGTPPKVSFKPSGMAGKAGSVYLTTSGNTDVERQRAITVISTGRVRLYRRLAGGWE
jgi:prepilin-type N-terminal cleavage/methylation domain-containing protein